MPPLAVLSTAVQGDAMTQTAATVAEGEKILIVDDDARLRLSLIHI